jgi:hypothetical protein
MELDALEPVSHDQIILDQIKVGVTHRVTRQVAESLRIETWRDDLVDGLVYGLSAYVLAHQLGPDRIEREESTTFIRPATWWQAWKEEHPRVWRGWLARRWPVRTLTATRTLTLTVDLRRYRTFPLATINYPAALGRPVNVLIPSSSLRWSP